MNIMVNVEVDPITGEIMAFINTWIGRREVPVRYRGNSSVSLIEEYDYTCYFIKETLTVL